jgi:UPF0755 protein
MKRLTRLTQLLLAAGFVLIGAWLMLVVMPVPLAEDRLLVRVPQGASLRVAAQTLNRSGVQVTPWIITGVGRVAGLSTTIKAGSYEFDRGISLWSLLRKLSSGDTSQGEVLLVEGITFRELRARLNAQPDLIHTTQALSDQAIMARLGVAERQPQGWFFPDTYRFDKRSEDIEVLARALALMQKQLDAAWQGREDSLPLKTPYELLILASIVEKETGAVADRAEIAGVFVNRLRKGMRLQTDPTVIYGLGERFDGNLRKGDLQRDTPHNTYTRAGLPPTPICMPGQASLLAAAHPAKTDALYFVARGDGSSHFSATLESHNQAVNQYQRGKP